MKKIIIPILGLLVLVLGAAALYFYVQISAVKKDPDALARKEAETLVGVVGKLIILPKDEVPTVATVSDPTKLADQAFFAKAKVGDKVLLFPKAKKAYLYDPVAKRILEVAPINLDGAVVDPNAPAITDESQVPDVAAPTL